MRQLLSALVLAALVACGLSACQEAEDRDLVVLLLPDEDGGARWSAQDRPAFEAAVEASCASCVVEVHQAAGSESTQRAQFADALEQGADVIVLVSLTAEAGEMMVQDAGTTPVIAYDRFVAGADYFVTVDSAQVGTLQARAVLAAAGPKPHVMMINGPADDPNAALVKLAAHAVLEDSGARILAEVDPVDGQTSTAQEWVTDQLAAMKGKRIDAVYAASDAQAGGVVAAFRADKRPLPVLTGQDADLEALRRIVLGEQTMTVYRSVPDEAGAAARVAVRLIAGRKVGGTEPYEGVPSIIFDPVAVRLDNLTDTVVRDGAVGIEELCAGPVLATCESLGLA
ncbi:substrate-binding domain-containing protein [Nocardioides sp.]|uniref:substrate-binding domain-containing protein n=1 Tax=Nocardioides sp. TaxID=35761 RepID=UPI003D0BF182